MTTEPPETDIVQYMYCIIYTSMVVQNVYKYLIKLHEI